MDGQVEDALEERGVTVHRGAGESSAVLVAPELLDVARYHVARPGAPKDTLPELGEALLVSGGLLGLKDWAIPLDQVGDGEALALCLPS